VNEYDQLTSFEQFAEEESGSHIHGYNTDEVRGYVEQQKEAGVPKCLIEKTIKTFNPTRIKVIPL